MKKLYIIIIFIVIILPLNGCIKEKNEEVLKEKKENIVLGVKKLPETLNVIDDIPDDNKPIIYSLFDGLVELTDTGNIIGALAESFEIKENGLEYIFKIRKNAFWSDGEKITSEDFVEFFKNILNSKEINVEELYSVYGVKEYSNGTISFEKGVSIMASDKDTLKIRMNNKDDDFLFKLTKPKYKLRKFNSSINNYKENIDKIITSGSYKINKIIDNENIELIKNKYYWDEEVTSTEKILIKQVGSTELGLVSLLINEIDILGNIPISEARDLLKKGNLNILPLDLTKVLNLNSSKILTSDINFREAIEKSLMFGLSDLNTIINFKGELAKGNISRDKEKGKIKLKLEKDIDYSSEKEKYKHIAKEFMKLIDYNGEPIILIGEMNDENNELSLFLKKVLKDTLKINLDIKLFNKKDLENELKKDNYDISIMDYKYNDKDNKSLEQKYLIPLYFENMFTCKGNNIDYISYYGDNVLKLKHITLKK